MKCGDAQDHKQSTGDTNASLQRRKKKKDNLGTVPKHFQEIGVLKVPLPVGYISVSLEFPNPTHNYVLHRVSGVTCECNRAVIIAGVESMRWSNVDRFRRKRRLSHNTTTDVIKKLDCMHTPPSYHFLATKACISLLKTQEHRAQH